MPTQDDLLVRFGANLDDLVKAFAEGQEAIGSAFARISEEVAGINEKLGEVGGATSGAREHMGQLAKAGEDLKDTIHELAVAWLGFEGLKFVTEHMIESENAAVQLDAAWQATGRTAGVTRQQLDEYAESIAKVTTHSADEVKQAEAMLLTFTKVRGEGFERTLKAATELSARLGTDLVSATRMLGRAIQEPETGMQSLQRAGIQLGDSQKVLIQEFINSGESAKAQDVILRAIESTFHGTSAAAKDTLGGALKDLKKNFADLFSGTREGSAEAKKAIQGLADVLKDPEFKSAVDYLVTGFSKFVELIAKGATGWKYIFAGSSDPIIQTDDALKKVMDRMAVVQKIIAGSNPQATKFLEPFKKELADLQKQFDDLKRKQEVQLGLGAPASKEEKEKFGVAAKKDEAKTGGGKPSPYAPTEDDIRKVQEFELSREKLSLSLAIQGSEQKVAIAKDMLERIGKLYGMHSAEFTAALGALAQASQEYAHQQAALEAQSEAQSREAQLADLDIRRDLRQRDLQNHEITLEQFYAAENADIQDRLRINVAYYSRLKTLYFDNEAAVKKAQGDIAKAVKESQKQQTETTSRFMKDEQEKYKKMFEPLASSFGGVVKGLLQGTQAFHGAWLRILDDMAGRWIDLGEKMVTNWIAKQVAMSAVHAEQTAIREATDAQAAATSTAVGGKAALKSIFADSRAAMASVFKSVAAIPYVGWILAPAAALAAGAAVLAFGSGIASAAGGWEVPEDQLAMVHKNEMILPASISAGLKDMISGGGGRSGDTNLAISAVDAKSVLKLFQQNGRGLSRVMAKQLRKFDRGGS